MDAPKPSVVVIAGPTASGKSALALSLAERFGGEIVNADSMQVYRGMDVGTAKPTAADRARIPHHLFDVVLPDEQYSAGRYAHEARLAVAEIAARGRVPLLVGGTGLYVRAFLEGLIEGAPKDVELRALLEAEHEAALRDADPGRLHRRLRGVDPEAATRIHPNDLRRIVRALELHALTGRPASSLHREHDRGERAVRALYLVLDPGADALAARIDRRCEVMLESGLLQEVRALREKGYGPDLPSMQAIGYRHMEPVIQGLETLRSILPLMQRDTRQFARRQRTWFRAVSDAVWLDPVHEPQVTSRVAAFLSPASAQRGEVLGAERSARSEP